VARAAPCVGLLCGSSTLQPVAREVIGELKAVIAVRSNSMVARKSLKTWSGRRDSNPPIHMLPYARLSQTIDNTRQPITSIAAYVGVLLWEVSKC
jgi:hypothetical protein